VARSEHRGEKRAQRGAAKYEGGAGETLPLYDPF
jgi:hypothetical protein